MGGIVSGEISWDGMILSWWVGMGCLCLLEREEGCCFTLALFEDWVKIGRRVSLANEALKECLCFLLDILLVGA